MLFHGDLGLTHSAVGTEEHTRIGLFSEQDLIPAFLHLLNAIRCGSNPSIQNTLLRLSNVTEYVTDDMYSVTEYILNVSFPTLLSHSKTSWCKQLLSPS